MWRSSQWSIFLKNNRVVVDIEAIESDQNRDDNEYLIWNWTNQRSRVTV